MYKSYILTLTTLILCGCASSNFKAISENEYELSKMSDACSVGSANSVLNHLREESSKFCAGRKEKPVEIRSESVMAIPALRCASATLVFKCVPFE